jgi:hypothetical protein
MSKDIGMQQSPWWISVRLYEVSTALCLTGTRLEMGDDSIFESVDGEEREYAQRKLG